MQESQNFCFSNTLTCLEWTFGKTSVYDKAQSNEKDKDKDEDKDKDKNKDIGTNNMDLVWQAKHGYITGHSTISAVQLSLQPHNRPSSF